MGFKEITLNHAPYWVQDFAISIFNNRQYQQRHGQAYRQWREYFSSFQFASAEALQKEQTRRLSEFLAFVASNSNWYAPHKGLHLDSFPVLEKSDVLGNLNQLSTVDTKHGVIRLTGGTTGASMRVIYRLSDVQERHAALDHFRALYGYKLGKSVAWFSGKEIVNARDLRRGRVYRDDWINKIRFFSTFHICPSHFEKYWEALSELAPEYLVGFPSSVFELCRLAKEHDVRADWKISTYFPTAETVLPEHREVISEVLGCRIKDQYASSEGAPFIFECPAGELHMHTLTGVFEVVDEAGCAADEGELLVTAFATRGTPLVRYRIGDRISLGSQSATCSCGWSFPLVNRIEGRATDFVFSSTNGRVNVTNICNCTKGVRGIQCFQVVQRVVDRLEITIEANSEFSEEETTKLLHALRLRVGDEMRIDLSLVDRIPRERSGKFRIVKNLL